MKSQDWSYTVHHDFQQAGVQTAPLGRWTAAQSTGRTAAGYQPAIYAGQAAAVLLGVVGLCSVIAQFVFG